MIKLLRCVSSEIPKPWKYSNIVVVKSQMIKVVKCVYSEIPNFENVLGNFYYQISNDKLHQMCFF